MTLKKTKEIIGSYLEKVKVSPETDPKIQEMTKELQKKGYKWLEQKVTYAGIKQRWLIVESTERKQSEIQKLNLKIEQEKKTALKSIKKLETTIAIPFYLCQKSYRFLGIGNRQCSMGKSFRVYF